MKPKSSLSSPVGRIRRTLFLFLSFVCTACLFGQGSGVGEISGRITSATNAPLSGAIVTLQEIGRDAATDRDGTFAMMNVAPGTYTASISYLGLPTKQVTVVVTAGAAANLSVKLGEEIVQLETFKVEGQRAGQARALNEQRASGNLRNIVSADALGRFPDQNAAETMQRITGVSLERDQGEGRFISVRGVDPDLNNTQLNGINLPASEEDTRKINLDVFPTDILDSIEVV